MTDDLKGDPIKSHKINIPSQSFNSSNACFIFLLIFQTESSILKSI